MPGNSSASNVKPLPLKPDFKAVVTKSKAKADPTAALRQKRARAKRKMLSASSSATVTPVSSVTVAQPEKPNDIKPTVTVRHDERHGPDAPASRRTSWSLVMLAFGFFLLGVSINVWNAWAAGNIADTALPAAMGVLAEGVVFFLPARAVTLPVGRRVLAFVLLLFVSAFALTNSLRMASIVAADQTAARADRQTVGVQTADHALDAARAERDKACAKGQGKTIACQARQTEVTKLEEAQKQATGKVAIQARPEADDFAKLVTWASFGRLQPGADDFLMLWLLFRTFLPQIGGLVLMLARR
jgi:hypothetical protein